MLYVEMNSPPWLIIRGAAYRSDKPNAQNVCFQIFLPWPIFIISPVDKSNLSCYTSRQRSTTVSLETYPLYSYIKVVLFQFTQRMQTRSCQNASETWKLG